MASWSVATVDEAREPAWTALVRDAPASPLSHSLRWRRALRALGLGEPIYWLALQDGVPRAGLPAFVRRSPRGAVLNSLPFVQSTGGVVSAAAASPGERAEAAALLHEHLLAHCRDDQIDVACVVGSPYPGADQPPAPPPDFEMVRTTNVLDLAAPFSPRPSVEWTVRKA